MEIIVIAAYCPDLKRQDLLRNLVRYLHSNNKDILLISHSQIPEDIIKQCKFYFYDEENKFLTDDELKMWYYFFQDDFEIRSKDPYQYSVHILPVYRLFLYGLGIAKLLGYEYVHYLEYDNEITDINFINNNTKILKEGYGNVYYHQDDLEMQGGYNAWNLNHYSFEDLKYNEKDIINKYKKHNLHPERITKIEYINPKNPYVKNNKILQKEGLISNLNFSLKEKNSWVCPVIKEDGTFFILYNRNNTGKELEEIEIIINNSYLKESNKKGVWKIIYTKHLIDEVKYLKVLENNKILFEYDLTNPLEKERLFNNNIFIQK
jgi:hypothetical protein